MRQAAVPPLCFALFAGLSPPLCVWLGKEVGRLAAHAQVPSDSPSSRVQASLQNMQSLSRSQRTDTQQIAPTPSANAARVPTLHHMSMLADAPTQNNAVDTPRRTCEKISTLWPSGSRRLSRRSSSANLPQSRTSTSAVGSMWLPVGRDGRIAEKRGQVQVRCQHKGKPIESSPGQGSAAVVSSGCLHAHWRMRGTTGATRCHHALPAPRAGAQQPGRASHACTSPRLPTHVLLQARRPHPPTVERAGDEVGVVAVLAHLHEHVVEGGHRGAAAPLAHLVHLLLQGRTDDQAACPTKNRGLPSSKRLWHGPTAAGWRRRRAPAGGGGSNQRAHAAGGMPQAVVAVSSGVAARPQAGGMRGAPLTLSVLSSSCWFSSFCFSAIEAYRMTCKPGGPHQWLQ